jgi:2-oxoisovalerate dehydrogenase E2 component (dihydrolipoyl transacylase)
MATVVMKMPDVGEGVVEAEIVAWHVQPGAVVAEDQHIVDVMTNKATVEITAPVAGSVTITHGLPGDRLAVGAPLVVFETAAVAADVKADSSRSSPASAPSASRVMSPRPMPPPADVRMPDAGRVAAAPERVAVPSRQRHESLAAPAVRRRAREAHVSLADVPASGPNGRISHEDLDRFIARGHAGAGSSPAAASQAIPSPSPDTSSHAIPAAGETRVERIIGVRRAIAEKMALSKRRIPHYSYVEEVDVTELRSLIDHLNADRADGLPRLGYLPFIMKALVLSLRQFPRCNAHFDDEAGVLTHYASVHLGVATQTPDGLRVPVIREAQALSVSQLADEVRRLGAAARNATLGPQELAGSTITITSLGKLGGIVSTPVINHPEVAILGVNRAVERAAVVNGAIGVRVMMNLSASFDHRIVDGYEGASLVQAVKSLLEHPATVFMAAGE